MQINITSTAIDLDFKKAIKYLPIRLSTGYFDDIVECIAFTANRASVENGGYPPTQNGDIRSLFMLFTLMAMQN